MAFRRPLCFLLVLMMLASACLSACSGGEEKEPVNSGTAVTDPSGTPVTNAPEPETEAVDPDTVHDLPEGLDFGGAAFTMASTENWSCLVNYEDTNGEALNDAKYEVKRYAEELLSVSVTEELTLPAEAGGTAINYVLSGETEIQVFNLLDRAAISSAMRNVFLPLSRARYIDLSKKYWGIGVAEKLSVGGFQFLALDSFQLNSFRNAGCLFMNLSVADNYNLPIPYDLVETGKWTFDALAAYSGAVLNDVDGDGDLTPDDAVTFGSTDHRQTLLNFMSAAEVPFMGKDEKNYPCFTCFGNEKLIDVMTWVKKTFFNAATSIASKADGDSMVTTGMFIHDRQLFLLGRLGNMLGDEMRNMDSVYAVFPYPKYDESQAEYISRAVDGIFPMIINTATDPDMVSAVLEAMSARAYQELLPALVETSLQFKYNNDPRSVENIQIVFDTRTVELSDMIVWSTFGDTPTWRLMYRDIPPVSWLESVQTGAGTTLERFLANAQELMNQ